MITLQELEPVEALDNEIKYCHLLCCHPNITLCGAYKPQKCGVSAINGEGMILISCPVCHKDVCPDCLQLIDDDCPWCED